MLGRFDEMDQIMSVLPEHDDACDDLMHGHLLV